jgi:hypothetical protein
VIRHFYRSLALPAILFVLLTAGCGAPSTSWIPAAETYRSWQSWPEEPIDTPVPGHRDTVRLIYISPEAMKVVVDSEGGANYPDGSVIVKEVYPSLDAVSAGRPNRLTVMVKRPDLDEALDGWIWLTKDPDEEREKIIDHQFCVECHEGANSSHPYGDGNPAGVFRDFVFIPHYGGE